MKSFFHLFFYYSISFSSQYFTTFLCSFQIFMYQLVLNSCSSVPPTLAWLICLPLLDWWPLLGLPAFAIRATIYTPHATAPHQNNSGPHACTTTAWGPLALLQLPLFCSRCTYCLSLKLEPSPKLPLYIFLRVSCNAHPLLHHCAVSCTPRAPPITVVGLPAPWLSATNTRAHLVHYSISCTTQSRAQLNLVHYSISCTSYSCTSRAPLVHHLYSCTNRSRASLVHQSFSCTSRAPPITVVGLPTPWPLALILVHLSCTSNHCRGTSRSLAIGTSYSCTSRALLNFVHYSISCTTQSRALLNLVHYSISCASRAPLILVRQSFLCSSRAPPISVVGLPASWPSALISCTSRAPLVHLQSLLWDFLLLGRRHLILMHFSCTTQSRALLNLVHYSISCTSHSCASCAPLILVRLSCTSNHCRGTSRSLAVGTSYSCTRTRAPTCALTRAGAPIIKPTHCPIQEGVRPSPWQAHNIPLAIVNLLTPSAHLS